MKSAVTQPIQCRGGCTQVMQTIMRTRSQSLTRRFWLFSPVFHHLWARISRHWERVFTLCTSSLFKYIKLHVTSNTSFFVFSLPLNKNHRSYSGQIYTRRINCTCKLREKPYSPIDMFKDLWIQIEVSQNCSSVNIKLPVKQKFGCMSIL